METQQLVFIALLLALILLLVRVRARARETTGAPGERWLDTVTDWPPTATRIMTTPERIAYETLVRALPGYVVLAQVPLARFIKVQSRHSHTEWLRRMGHQCADLLVCDSASAVLAVIAVQPPPAQTSERARNRHRRMSRVLKAAKIPLHLWTTSALPTEDAARRLLLAKADEAAPSSLTRQRAAPRVPAPTPPVRSIPTRTRNRSARDPYPGSRRLRHGSMISKRDAQRNSRPVREPELGTQASNASANSRALKVCRSSSFSPTPMK